MALTTTEEALVRQLLGQQAAILSLAGNESTITSKLGATKVTLADLVAASSVADTDLLLTRQGTTDKSVRADILADYMEAELGALFAPIATPTFTGDPKAPTPPQFDNGTSLATTAFVQRALGNYAGQVSVSTSRSLLASESGLIVNAYGTITVTLPVSSGVPLAGASYQINNAGSGIVTVTAGAGDNLYGIGNATPRTFVLGSGDSITVAYVGGTSWYAWGGLQLGASAAFGSSRAADGYQKLPSGLIIQWGSATPSASTLNFPVAFPTACQSIQATCYVDANGGGGSTEYQPLAYIVSASQFRLRTGTSNLVPLRWIAIGY